MNKTDNIPFLWSLHFSGRRKTTNKQLNKHTICQVVVSAMQINGDDVLVSESWWEAVATLE